MKKDWNTNSQTFSCAQIFLMNMYETWLKGRINLYLHWKNTRDPKHLFHSINHALSTFYFIEFHLFKKSKRLSDSNIIISREEIYNFSLLLPYFLFCHSLLNFICSRNLKDYLKAILLYHEKKSTTKVNCYPTFCFVIPWLNTPRIDQVLFKATLLRRFCVHLYSTFLKQDLF